MKRFMEKIKSFFTGPEKATHIGYFIGITICLAMAIFLISTLDKTPASESDFKELEDQITAIQQTPALLFQTDCEIEVADKIITVKLESEECGLTAKFNQDFEILSTKKIDSSDGWKVGAVLVSIICLGFIYPLSECIRGIIIIIEDVSTSIKRRKKSK